VAPRNFSTVFAVQTGMKQDHPVAASRWVHVSILVGVGLFILALTLSAVFVPQLRLLHLFQAVIYVVVIILTRQNSAWGFGAGVINSGTADVRIARP
jgi:hypothetical protein